MEAKVVVQSPFNAAQFFEINAFAIYLFICIAKGLG